MDSVLFFNFAERFNLKQDKVEPDEKHTVSLKNQNIETRRTSSEVEKFARGTCRHDEALSVVQWLKDPSKKSSLQQPLEKLWDKHLEEKGVHDEAVDLQPTLDRIHDHISMQWEQPDPGFQKKLRIYKILLRVAAVLFVPLLITTSLYIHEQTRTSATKDQYTELTVSYGSKLHTVLPDGTTVWINSGSKLEYPQTFSKKNRSVKLSGEAYFDVTLNRQHPFVVETEAINIKVLGTRFNVTAYPGEETISATLEEGSVAIETGGKKSSSLCLLEPNEQMVFQKENRTFQKRTVQTDLFTSWKDGKLVFRNSSLNYMINQLERWFNTDIEITNEGGLPQTPFTMTIEDETLEQVLKYLSVASGITYDVVPAQRMESGEISRRRYIITN